MRDNGYDENGTGDEVDEKEWRIDVRVRLYDVNVDQLMRGAWRRIENGLENHAGGVIVVKDDYGIDELKILKDVLEKNGEKNHVGDVQCVY